MNAGIVSHWTERTMIRETLREFRDWLESNGADYEAAVPLEWISEFETEADADEDEYRAFKALAASTERPDAVGTMRLIERFETEHEPEDGLSRFQDWLKARCGEASALLSLNWIAKFELAQKESTAHQH
jgi:hypothetical protein